MPSELVQRQIDRLLSEAEQALVERDWAKVRDCATDVLDLDPENDGAQELLVGAERALSRLASATNAEQSAGTERSTPLPKSFASGRYAVRSLLGEGGKKLVYLAHDERLDRDVALALIKSDGMDDAGRQRITREAQAMGKLGDHPCLMPIHDVGEEDGQPYLVLPLMPEATSSRCWKKSRSTG